MRSRSASLREIAVYSNNQPNNSPKVNPKALAKWLSRHLGEKSIISYKIIGGGLRRESRLIRISSKLILRLTHPTNYKILLSPQVRESQQNQVRVK